uniref:Uncharacterized protein n=1 Tax=Kalanchoe fedtschenkoi TaxID=63787 RepID=A0A7N0UE92_KALFE
MAAITTIILLVFATSLTAAPSASSIRTHPTDIDSLKSLKSALGGSTPIPGSCLASWNFSFDPCASASSDRFTCGLRCDTLLSSFARVTHLALDPAGYSGFLSSASLNLPFLQTLSLSDNFLFGPLPASISNLTRLQKLVLSRNSFSGELPDSISALTHLEELCLDNNRFQGRIFNNLMIRKLQRLKRLELQGNLFSGHLPPAALASLPDLYFLDASDNELVGKISPGTLPKSLVELSLRNNSFDSYVPGTFSEVANLQVLDLSHNSLSGSVSRVFFAHQSLQQLSLSHNNLSSIETPSSFNQSSLVSVDMSHNRLQGPLPEFMAWLPALSSLSLEQNRLSGVIPSEYAKRAAAGAGGRTTPFGRLLLGGNYLFGLIPGPLTRLKPGRVNIPSFSAKAPLRSPWLIATGS